MSAPSSRDRRKGIEAPHDVDFPKLNWINDEPSGVSTALMLQVRSNDSDVQF